MPEDAMFAVRSSSPDEDLAGASFAGGYETFLGVTRETLLEAVQGAFASAFDERVFVYKQQQGFAVEQPRIAVVVQLQVASDIAGVGFTLNPINNDYDEAVIDANWGLGESVVSGMVTSDNFVVNKVSKTIIEKTLGSKEAAVWLMPDGGIEEQPGQKTDEFCLTDAQALEIGDLLSQIEELYQQPTDIEWAFAGGKLYMLQARPITTHVPLPPEMITAPGERRTLYLDYATKDGLTINAPITPLTLSWMFTWMDAFVPMFGSMEISAGQGSPQESVLFVAGGRPYANLSQLFHVVTPEKLADAEETLDMILAAILRNIDKEQYLAPEKNERLSTSRLLKKGPRSLWQARRFYVKTVEAVANAERFYHNQYEPKLEIFDRKMREPVDYSLPLDELISSYTEKLRTFVAEISYPLVMPSLYCSTQINKLVADEPDDVKALADKLNLGAEGNETIEMGIAMYRMAQMLPAADFADLDLLVTRLEQRQLPANFLDAWAQFVEHYGFRAPAEMELANARYGEDPRLALEQMSYMAGSAYNPEETLQKNIAEREQAYEQLLATLDDKKRKKLQKSYEIVSLTGNVRDAPKYYLVLIGQATRQRALYDGEQFVAQGRLDKAEDIFYLTLNEIKQGNADPAFDLRQVVADKLPFYAKLQHVTSFPSVIDSRGRIPQVKPPEGDPNTLVGFGISRGVGTGRVKVLHSPREKPIEKGDVLVAYTTDPGWTPLFVNAEAIILEVGSMLQHGGVVAREYGKPCVSSIQGITSTLQDGQLVEVDGTTGVVRILES
jgi:pyruvate,water dikinase